MTHLVIDVKLMAKDFVRVAVADPTWNADSDSELINPNPSKKILRTGSELIKFYSGYLDLIPVPVMCE